ncbi:Sushi, von Willebrand factor type A, EGF and pentraxin domain-containing protein 1 [Exaiptasia diaphana]|nr:Sushi, von Willebrand factor type A, EGF and pentraxin domain-containing protein 1 [Exaiptasia diaphana]
MHDGNHISYPESVLRSNGYVYVNVPTRPPKRCSQAKAEQVLSFSRKSAQDYAILDDPFVSVSAFTLSFWVQVDATSTSNAVFEYGTTTDDNAVSIYVTDSYVGVNVIGANKILYGVNLVDNKWHHLCLTWENTDGNIKFYIDAVLRHEFIGKKDEQLGKGSIVLGQDQKGFKTGFRDSVAFKGNLASVNMWSRAFPAGEVSVLASTCPTSEGDIVQWSTLKTKRSGMLELVCSNYCM